jgi:UDP-N-acetylglucosamine acyltransferase
MPIHHTAIIDPKAQIGKNVSVGPFSVIGPKVQIGENSTIGSHVQIEGKSVIGKNCEIYQGASLGGNPQILGFDVNISSSIRIGDRTQIREYVTIHRSGFEDGVTQVGEDCLLMAYTHVAHDCLIGNHVVMVNYTGLPGHIVVEDKAFISGLVGIHQFARIGKYAMVGGMAAVRKDVIPFALVEGNPARLVGLNSVGLRRNDFAPKIRSSIKSAIKMIKDPDLNTSQAAEKIESEIEMVPEIRYLVDFINASSRGITK